VTGEREATVADKGVSPLPREARPYQGRRAGVVTRLVASVIDGLVVTGSLVVGYAVLAGLAFMIDPRGFTFPDPSVLLSLTAGLVVSVLYLTASWSIGGRSYGDHLMGLRVVGARGRRLSLVVAFLRALACVLFPIGLLWCAVSPANRSVQDLLLRSSVVYDWQSHAQITGRS
jgi:uncharacterized RDD family membrane protein YckC